MTTDGLTQLSALADELFNAKAKLAEQDAEMKQTGDNIKRLEEHAIPDLMDDLKVTEFKTTSGLSISVKDRLSARKLTQAHPEALQWLRDNHQGGLIRTTVGVPFTAGLEDKANELVESLAGKGFAVSKNMEVHHSSLAAAIRRMLADGEDVPMDLLGGYQSRVASIQVKKK